MWADFGRKLHSQLYEFYRDDEKKKDFKKSTP
jgi:hypothetical protein